MKKIMILANDTTYVYNLRGALIRELVNKKNKIYVVAQVLNFKEELEKIGCTIIDMSIGRHGTNPFSDLKLLKEYKKIMKEVQPDIVLSYNIKPNVYGGMATKKYNIKFMPNITGLGIALEYPGIMQIITIILNKIGLSNANTIFFQNQENLDFFKRKKIISKNTKTILLPGSGVDLEKHQILEYPKDKKIKFLFIARIMKDKGIDIYLETAKIIKEKYPNTEFHICGYCDDEKYKKILEKYQKKDIIIYHGEQKNMIPFFEMAHCVVHPSYYPEGMSNVLLEAAAHGRPIICTNRSGCKETVNNNETGFIVPIKNVNEVINAVEKIIKMTNKERKQMGIKGREKIEKEFDRKKIVESYLNEINKCNKKIIIHLLTSNIYSGAENVAISIIEKFKDEYNSIYVCKKGKVEDLLKRKNINYIALDKVNYFTLRKVIKKYRPNLIHAHGFTTSVICSLMGNKINYISHLHNNKLWLKKFNIKSLLYLHAGKKSKQVLIVSNSIKNEYIFSNKIKDKIINIDNPVSFEKVNEKLTKKLVKKEYDICCVARITEQKNPKKFIRVIKSVKDKYPDIKAVWVGDGELKNEILEYSKNLGVFNNVDFVGFMDNPYDYMNLSKMFVLTSDWEGYGLVAFEALSIGLPCIVSNVGGLPNIVDDTCGNLCMSEEEFEDSIITLIQDKELLEKKSNSAIVKASQLDNTKKYFDELNQIYMKLTK